MTAARNNISEMSVMPVHIPDEWKTCPTDVNPIEKMSVGPGIIFRTRTFKRGTRCVSYFFHFISFLSFFLFVGAQNLIFFLGLNFVTISLSIS